MDWRLKRAFTLMELLVVLAVIGVLVALLLPVLSRARAGAQRTVCLNHLRQLNLAVRLYADETGDASPAAGEQTNSPAVFSAYKQLMKNYLGSPGRGATRDRWFACPADTFYYDYAFTAQPRGYVPESLYAQSNNDYSSYAFNAGNLNHITFYGTKLTEPGIAGRKLSSTRHPARTVLLAEMPAFIPYSWHQPKRPFGPANSIFRDSRNVVSFVDGHTSYIRMYWDSSWPAGTLALAQDPPAGYDYQWSGD